MDRAVQAARAAFPSWSGAAPVEQPKILTTLARLLAAAVHGAVAASRITTGQDCTAATRAIVHRSRYAEFVAGVADLFSSVRLGPTADPETDLGPVISTAHRDKIAAMVDRSRSYARVVTGGSTPGRELSSGSYCSPTLIADAGKTTEVIRDEIFGPVLCAMQFDDDEAITLANDSPYGLAPSAWTCDLHRALRATREIRAGCVWVNDHIPVISEMPRWDEGVRLRKGHVELCVRRVHGGQARDVRPTRPRGQGLAPHDLRCAGRPLAVRTA